MRFWKRFYKAKIGSRNRVRKLLRLVSLSVVWGWIEWKPKGRPLVIVGSSQAIHL